MRLGALPGKVLVEFEPYVERTAKGIEGFVIADPKHEGLPYKGTVLAVGSGVRDVAVGDRIIYKEQSPQGFEYDGKKIIPVLGKNVLAKIGPND